MTDAVAAFPPSFVLLTFATFGAVALGHVVGVLLYRYLRVLWRGYTTTVNMFERLNVQASVGLYMRALIFALLAVATAWLGLRWVWIRYLNRELEDEDEPQT